MAEHRWCELLLTTKVTKDTHKYQPRNAKNWRINAKKITIDIREKYNEMVTQLLDNQDASAQITDLNFILTSAAADTLPGKYKSTSSSLCKPIKALPFMPHKKQMIVLHRKLLSVTPDNPNYNEIQMKISNLAQIYVGGPMPERQDKPALLNTVRYARKLLETQRQKLLKSLIKERTQDRITSFLENQKKHIISIFERKIDPQPLTTIIRDGILITEPDQVKTGITDYYRTIFTPVERGSTPNSSWSQEDWVKYYTTDDSIQTEWYSGLMAPITLPELQTQINKLPSNKAPGPSGVSYDHLKLLNNDSNSDGETCTSRSQD